MFFLSFLKSQVQFLDKTFNFFQDLKRLTIPLCLCSFGCICNVWNSGISNLFAFWAVRSNQVVGSLLNKMVILAHCVLPRNFILPTEIMHPCLTKFLDPCHLCHKNQIWLVVVVMVHQIYHVLIFIPYKIAISKSTLKPNFHMTSIREE